MRLSLRRKETCKRYFCFLKEKLMKSKQAALAANANYNTARNQKRSYEDDPERNIPVKKPIKLLIDQSAS
jgi:hypothetical protein